MKEKEEAPGAALTPEIVVPTPYADDGQPAGLLAVRGGLSPEEAIKMLDKVVDLMNKVRPVLIKGTKPQDWVKQRDKFYLQGCGVERIAPILGIETTNVATREIKDDATGIVRVVTSGDISSRLLNISYEGVEGSRSSDDGFFTKDGAQVADISYLRKASYSQFLARGVAQIGGLRGLVEDDLKAGGLDVTRIKGIEYKEGKFSGKDVTAAPEGTQTAIAGVGEVSMRKSQNGKSTIYTIHADDGEKYGTFSESIAQLAKDAKAGGKQLAIEYETNKFGRQVKTLKIVEPKAAAEVPAEPEAAK